jgi:hypothetical protein
MRAGLIMLRGLLATLTILLQLRDACAQTWWNTLTQGDWAGKDRACSQGATPRPSECTPAFYGQVAVCWTNRRTGECGGATAWCTYKFVELNTPQNGANPGMVYQCRPN